MIDRRVFYALENFLDSVYFESQQEMYELTESDNFGKARIFLNVGSKDNICVRNYDDTPLWDILRKEKNILRKRIDHFILRKNANIWELHLIEMKKTVNANVWQSIKTQMSGSYLTIKALLTFLGISIQDENIFVYTAYGEDKMTANDSKAEGVTTGIFKTGERIINPKYEEWDAGFIHIPIIDSKGNIHSKKFRHIKIKMTVAGDGVLERNFNLPI